MTRGRSIPQAERDKLLTWLVNSSGESAPAFGLIRIGAKTGGRALLAGLKMDYSGRTSIGILPGHDTADGVNVRVTREGDAPALVSVPAGATLRAQKTSGSGYDRAGPMAGSWYAQADQIGPLLVLQVWDPDTGAQADSYTNGTGSAVNVLALCQITKRKADYRIFVDEDGNEIGTCTDIVFDPAAYTVAVTDFGVPEVDLV